MGPAAAFTDFTTLRERAGHDWHALPFRVRALIEGTLLNPQSRSDAMILLCEAMAELAKELFDPRLTTSFKAVADHLRDLAPRRA